MTQDKIDQNWEKEGMAESHILMGDLYQTHLNLMKFVCLSNLDKIAVSNEKQSIILPKENSAIMINKILWITSLLSAHHMQAVKEGTPLKIRTNSWMTFDAFNGIMGMHGRKYKSLDSRQRF